MRKCKTCNEEKPLTAFRPNRYRCKQCTNRLQWQWFKKNPVSVMLQSAKFRAKRDHLPFSLSKSDIIIPDVCPVLGYKLVAGDRHNHDFAPTIDRIKPELGYVPGNIIVVSYRANRIKNDATLEELSKIVRFYHKPTAGWDSAVWDGIRACVHNPAASGPECSICYRPQ